MAKITAAVGGILVTVILLIAAAAGGLMQGLGSGGSQPSRSALTDIPDDYLALYQQAATTCPGLDWSVLAAIGKIESDHGRSTLPGVHSGENYAGARGPMQFLQPTFDQVIANHPIPQNGTATPSPYEPDDAIPAAAAYLCDSGARGGKDLRAAVYSYNHADWYVADVLTQAQEYQSSSGISTDVTVSPAALEAINYAKGQLGLPYVWGGNGPVAGDLGFDCSGLAKAAYAAADIPLPRTAQAQFNVGPRVPDGQALLPGDLVFYGSPNGGIHHVGLYIGGGQMINAPSFGKPIRIEPYRYRGDDYAGATRPPNLTIVN